ncbi:unnamed protein product [Lota lota]
MTEGWLFTADLLTFLPQRFVRAELFNQRGNELDRLEPFQRASKAPFCFTGSWASFTVSTAAIVTHGPAPGGAGRAAPHPRLPCLSNGFLMSRGPMVKQSVLVDRPECCSSTGFQDRFSPASPSRGP